MNVAMETVAGEYPAYKVDTYVFDGFMVRKPASTDSLPQDMLETLAGAVKEGTGFVVKFVEKSLTPTESDVLRVRPAFNNFMVQSQWDEAKVFNQLEMMAKNLNQNPAEGNAALFRKMLVPVMNQAFALVKGTVLLVATRYFDDCDSVDYKYMKWPAAREMYEEKTVCIMDGLERLFEEGTLLYEGKIFDTLREAETRIAEYCEVQTRGLRYRVKAKDGVTVVCPQHGCPFMCRVTGRVRQQNFMCTALTPHSCTVLTTHAAFTGRIRCCYTTAMFARIPAMATINIENGRARIALYTHTRTEADRIHRIRNAVLALGAATAAQQHYLRQRPRWRLTSGPGLQKH